jgi:peptide/nickel transport system substrate-binding protein
MKSRARPSGSKLRVASGLLGLSALVVVLVVNVVASAAPAATKKTAAHNCPVATGSGDTTFVRNFNPYQGDSPTRDFTWGAIYEPLVIVTAAGKGSITPWLAKSYAWSKDGKTLTLAIRPGVKWSDGKPLTNKDVVFSLTAGLKNPAMDRVGLTSKDREISSIHTASGNRVIIKLNQVDSTFFGNNLNAQFVVPQHIFAAHVADITKWTNPDPVGTGPFTKVVRFTAQDYVLGKNPHYWMPGAPHVSCLERLAATSNDAALVQIVSGQADWSHNFVANVETAYIAHDKAHYHSFYDTQALPIGLYFDVTKYPYSIVAFRKGLSQAIDRSKVSKLGEYGYAPPTDALGISGMWPGWVDKSLVPTAKKLATYNPAAAKATLTAAGFTYKGSKLYDPKGNPVSFQVHVIGGWSDWVASLNIITQNLRDIGVDASVKLEPDWNSWYPDASAGRIVSLLWNYGGGFTPYGFYKSHFDTASFRPSGQDEGCCGDWEHFQSAQGTQLLAQFRQTLDTKKQHQIVNQLQKIFLDNLPFIPLFIGPRWSTYSTKFFTGWTTPQNTYADPIFNTFPDNTLIFTRLRPAK